jgi:hypothetical protein
VTNRQLLKTPDIKNIKSAIYENYYEDGVSICYELSPNSTTYEIDSIFFYPQGPHSLCVRLRLKFVPGAEKNKYKGYKGSLPHGLTFDMTNADVVNKYLAFNFSV